MSTGIAVLTPFKKSLISYYGFFSLLLSAIVFASGLYFYLLKDIEEKSNTAKSALTHRMDTIFIELKKAVDGASLSCERKDVRRLQNSTFHSPTFKEFGLFDADFRVYCTNFGSRNFSIFSTVADRVRQSAAHTTVSLMKSHSLGEQSFFAFYLGENGIGANALASPQSLLTNIDHILSPNFPYELTVGKLAVTSNTLKTEVEALEQRQISLDDWAMTLNVVLPATLYWTKATDLWPLAILLWVTIWGVFCSIHLGLLHYRQSIYNGLKKAIKENKMEVYYQPIVSLKDNNVYDMEALIRWRSPYHGEVSPLSIIEMSRQLDLLDDLTWMVIRSVGQLYRENNALLSSITTAVNVDRYCLLNDDFIIKLRAVLEEYPELTGRLGLEVTETCALTATELPLVVSRFEHIKALDVSLSVDDFGTGYSGLDFLRRFPYDTLKLDRVFIANLKEDQFTQQVLTSITLLAKELGMKVVAEGVERKDQLEAVRSLGIDSVQGYYFCAPLPQHQALIWVDKNTNKSLEMAV